MKNTILFLLLIYSLTSCTTVQKLFHKNKSQIDSTSVTHEKKDSSASVDSIHVKSSQKENTDEIVVDYGDKQITVPYNDTTNDSGIYISPKNPDDYFYFNSKTGEIKGNRTPVKITIKGKAITNTYDSLANHSQIQLSDVSDQSTKVSKKEKEVVREVKKKSFLGGWWISIIAFIITFLIIRYWPKIKAFAIHLFTGL